MRFKVKPQPRFWDKKTVIRFAYFPIRVEDNIIWLEKYECTYRYTSTDNEYKLNYFYWEVTEKKLLNKTK
jgi:hypothetical protein